MSESTVGTKIGNCERWRQWASMLSGRGAVSRRRAPLTLEWMRHFSVRKSRLRLIRGGAPVQAFQVHVSIPLHLQLGSTFAPAAYGDAPATKYIEGSEAAQKAADPIVRYTRVEESTSTIKENHSNETERPYASSPSAFLRIALERTQRVEQRVTLRELVLARATGVRSHGTPQDSRGAQPHWSSESSGMPAYSRTLPAPPVNVDQIADTVMRQLDRRLVSWRERMGRL
jgi:hypothetical protein